MPDDLSGPERPFISVIVPVRNEELHIENTLDALLAQSYPRDRYEVLVVDGESEDRTCEFVEQYVIRYSHIHLMTNPRRLSSAARNIGVQAARGSLLLVVDGHCELTNRDYLANLADAFLRSGADCIGRPQPLNTSQATALQRAIAAARASWLGHHPASFIYADQEQFVPAHSVGVAYHRRVFEQVGLFDEAFDACEDVEFNHRVDQARLRCFFTSRLTLPYLPRRTLPALFRQLSRYGRGRMRLLRKHPDTLGVATLIPSLLTAGTVAGFPVGWLSAWAAWGYLGTLATYLALIILTSIFLTARSKDIRLLPWLPFVFVTIHFGAGTGFLLELFRPAAVPARVATVRQNHHARRCR